MTKNLMIDCLNEVLRHERKHFNFYQYAGFMIQGWERVFLKPLLDREMAGELEHVKMFAEKIVALEGTPTLEAKTWEPELNPQLKHAAVILTYAVRMEREVLALYHSLYEEAEKFADVFKDKSIVLLLEENIEHTTADVEEMEKILGSLPR